MHQRNDIGAAALLQRQQATVNRVLALRAPQRGKNRFPGLVSELLPVFILLLQDKDGAGDLGMCEQSIQAVFYQDRAKREKAEGFDLAREQKRRENTERRMWEHIERENRLLNKASKKRKKSTGGKGPRKMRKQPPKQGSLVESVECATEGLARASPNQESVTKVPQAPTANEPAGTLSMEDLAGEQEPNEREPSDGASSA